MGTAFRKAIDASLGNASFYATAFIGNYKADARLRLSHSKNKFNNWEQYCEDDDYDDDDDDDNDDNDAIVSSLVDKLLKGIPVHIDCVHRRASQAPEFNNLFHVKANGYVEFYDKLTEEVCRE